MLSKDGLKFYFALGLGNAAFTFVSEIFKYLDGDDEEAEEVMYEVKKSMVGFNQLIGIPFFGTAIETALVFMEDKRYTPSDGINPYVSLTTDLIKAYKYDTSLSKEVLEYTSGINTDFFIGVSNYLTGQVEPSSKYDIIGVPRGARHEKAK